MSDCYEFNSLQSLVHVLIVLVVSLFCRFVLEAVLLVFMLQHPTLA